MWLFPHRCCLIYERFLFLHAAPRWIPCFCNKNRGRRCQNPNFSPQIVTLSRVELANGGSDLSARACRSRTSEIFKSPLRLCKFENVLEKRRRLKVAEGSGDCKQFLASSPVTVAPAALRQPLGPNSTSARPASSLSATQGSQKAACHQITCLGFGFCFLMTG